MLIGHSDVFLRLWVKSILIVAVCWLARSVTGWPVPEIEVGLRQDGKPFFAFRYVLPGEVALYAQVRCHGFGLSPDRFRKILSDCIWHIGHGHNQGYGESTLKGWEVVQSKVIY